MQVDIKDCFYRLSLTLQREGIRFMPKRQSRFMRLLSKVFHIVPGVDPQAFMERYTTHIGKTIYLPDRWDTFSMIQQCSILSHELTHHKDQRKLTMPLYVFMYLSPQLLGVIGLIVAGVLCALDVSYWWAWLSCLLFLAPLPSPGRSWIEYRGYSTSMWVLHKVSGDLSSVPRGIPFQFTSGAYYWMGWSKKSVAKRLEDIRRSIATGGSGYCEHNHDLIPIFLIKTSQK